MRSQRERVEDRLLHTVCSACMYRLADGGCGMSPKYECPILRNMDKIIGIVRTTRSNKIDPYVERLREAVCANCEMQDAQGRCRMRDHSDCALDDYFPLIVEIIEDELERVAK
jgi:hypothetical protein